MTAPVLLEKPPWFTRDRACICHNIGIRIEHVYLECLLLYTYKIDNPLKNTNEYNVLSFWQCNLEHNVYIFRIK